LNADPHPAVAAHASAPNKRVGQFPLAVITVFNAAVQAVHDHRLEEPLAAAFVLTSSGTSVSQDFLRKSNCSLRVTVRE